MSNFTDLVNKGVRLILTTTNETETGPLASTAASTEPETVTEGPRRDPLPGLPQSADAASPSTTDFEAAYAEAGITVPAHGYGVERIAEMLRNPRLAALPEGVKVAAVLAALDAAGVAVGDVVADAEARLGALDAIESASEAEAARARAHGDARVRAVQEEIDAFLKARQAEIAALQERTEQAEDDLRVLRTRKQREEQRLREIVSPFREGGPVHTVVPAPVSASPDRDHSR